MKKTATQGEIEQTRAFKEWWKRNWKKVAFGAVVIGGGILIARNWDEVVAIVEKATTMLKPNTKVLPCVETPCVFKDTEMASSVEQAINMVCKSSENPFDVSQHIRNLPKDWNPSPEKIAEAAELQINLLPHQTLVDAYTKRIKVA